MGGQFSGEDDVTIQDRTNRIRYRVVHIVGLDQYREEACDETVLARAGALEELWQQ